MLVLPATEVEFEAQSKQLAGPRPALYWFILHWEHCCPFTPVYPALHSHAVMEVLPDAEIEFEGQSVQVDPTAGLYVPVAHCVHAAPFAPVYPLLH